MPILKSEVRNKFSSIPNSIIRCKDLSDGDYRLLIYLFSLPDNWQINQTYLGQELGCARENINKKISRIKEAGYLKVIKSTENKELQYVYVLQEKDEGSCDSNYHNLMCQEISHVIPTITHINTDNKVINNINKKEIENNKLFSTKKVLKKPTFEEVEEYCKKRKNNVDAKKFFYYYEANDWKDKNDEPVKNWKQKMIANWESKKKDNQPVPEWIDKKQKAEELDAEELEELEELFKEFKK